MPIFVSHFDVNAITWFWLSFLLGLIVFFRFNRLWSLRNLDLLLLLALSPGLIWVREGYPTTGYTWLFIMTGLLALRMGLDGLLTRRPRMEANLNLQGLATLAVAISGFLVHKIVTEPPPETTVQTVKNADHILKRQDATTSRSESEAGPTTSLLATPAALVGGVELAAARLLAALAHAAVVTALVLIGSWHFRDAALGWAMATLYLILPCTSMDVQLANHVLPSALIAWAFVFYQRPLVAGVLLGLACGSLFFPLFLLPLWLSFYDKKGAIKFGAALAGVTAVLLLSLVLTSADTLSFTKQIIGSINWTILEFQGTSPRGFWAEHQQAYRIPVFAVFAIVLVVVSIWPRTKTLEHLMANSATIVIGTQFWYPQQGGVYLLWYLPLVLMVVFRPRLVHQGPGTSFETSRTPSATKPRPATAPSPLTPTTAYRSGASSLRSGNPSQRPIAPVPTAQRR